MCFVALMDVSSGPLEAVEWGIKNINLLCWFELW